MSNHINCFEKITKKIDHNQLAITNKELIEICRSETQLLSRNGDPHQCHEIAEAAVNYLILTKYAEYALYANDRLTIVRELIRPLMMRLPTQSWRSTGQIKWQQYSTPPTIAYLTAYLLNLNGLDQVLEPSAGTGSLAVWSKGIGACTLTNEIDPRRRELLSSLNFAPTSYQAENIHDYLSPEIRVDCVMMNPPFSSSGGRTKNNSSKFGFRHVRSALERLNRGGRFGIILGEAGGLDTKTGNDFWRTLSDRIEIKSIIKIDGREYFKNGTTARLNLITGRKLLETNKPGWNQAVNKIINISVRTVEEACLRVNELGLRLDR